MKVLLTSRNKRCSDGEYRPERRLSLSGKCKDISMFLDRLRRQCDNMPISQMSFKAVIAALRLADTEQDDLSEELCGF